MGNQSAGTISEQFDLFLRSWKSADGSNKYIARIDRMIADGQVSVVVDYEDLLSFDTELATALIENPDRILSFFKEAAIQVVRTENLAYAESIEKQLQVRIAGLIDKLPLRGVSAKYLDRLVAINGMVVRTSEIKPRVVIAAYACPNEHITYVPQPTGSLKKPDKCSECNEGREFRLETKLSRFTDYQVIRLQELPEELPPGQLPQSIDAELLGDLVNRARPGDRIVITGIVRAEPESGIGAGRQSTFRTRLDANYIDVRGKELEQIQITPEDEAAIRRIAESPRAYDDLVKSIAPAIYGMEAEKEAALLLVAGAPQRILPDGTTLRGDINALIVGDPGCLIGDERVVLADGAIVKIQELGKRHLQPLNLEVMVDCDKKARATVFHAYRNQRVMEVVTESGRSVKGTPNHPLLALQNGRMVWKRLDQLKEGDMIAVVSRIPCSIRSLVSTGFQKGENGIKYPRFYDRRLASFLGYMLAHGWVDVKSGNFGFTAGNVDIRDKMIESVKKTFNLLPYQVKEIDGKYVVEYNCMQVSETLHEVANHRVPDGILKSGNRVVKEFLRWLFDNSDERFVIRDSNIELLRDLQMLLLRFSIHGRVSGCELEVSGEDALLLSDMLRNKAKYFRHRKGDPIIFERVERVLGSEQPMDVFDIEVPQVHRFIANGIISHNTGKSELLKYVARLAPRGLYTSGRGSTAAGLCVSADSFVITASGPRRISEIVEEEMRHGKAAVDVSIEMALSTRKREMLVPIAREIHLLSRRKGGILLFSGVALEQLVYGHAINYYRIIPKDVVRLRTSIGKELGATPETRIVCFEPASRTTFWKQVGEVKIGDWVVLASYIPDVSEHKILQPWKIIQEEDSLEIELDKIPLQAATALKDIFGSDKVVVNYRELLRICGKLKIDFQDILHGIVSVCSSKNSERTLFPQDYHGILRLVGICLNAVSIEQKQNSISLTFDERNSYEEALATVKKFFGVEPSGENGYTLKLNEHMTRLLKMLIDIDASGINVNRMISSLTNEELIEFLSYFIKDRATISKEGIEIKVPVKLAEQIDYALMRIGILCRIEDGKEWVRLTISDPESIMLLKQHFAIKEIENIKPDNSNLHRLGKFYAASRVTEIKRKREELVYDLTVEEGDAFIANGFLVHNTAAVVKEKSGLMMLEAGAVVLADLGVACIDEFDKMRPDDRGVLHEVMEQQTVSVAKGGIVATLNARTSIVAAANPLLGTYDPFKNIYENVNLPIPLLSRFDIIFIVKDTPDRIVDEKLATHILRTHRSRGFVTPPPIDFELLRKYIVYCKKIEPVLTQEAEAKLLEFYLQMRNVGGKENMITVTPRQLESLIRLATARARLLLRDKVTEDDALVAISLVRRMLATVGVDVRTGKIDIGVLSGRASSERTLIELALDVFKELQGTERTPVSLSAFTEALEKTGKFSRDEARKMINMLYKMGQIYEIKPGYYSRIT